MTLKLSLYGLVITFILALTTLVEAKCVKPAVRREWRSLSRTQQKNYMDAAKCLTKLPHNPSLTPTVPANQSQIPAINGSSSYYDDFVYIHMDLNTIIHFTGLFMPWHRLYLHSFEQALQEKCGYKDPHPYWDWTKDSADFEHSFLFNSDPEVGFGGWGDPNNDYQISTGAFADIIRSYPVPNHIRRNFTLQPWKSVGSPFPDNQTFINPEKMANSTFTPQIAETLLNDFAGDFLNWHAFMEGAEGPHGGIHQIISADMIGTCPSNAPSTCVWGAKWTPNDPLFFMHHGMVDKLWHDWQNKRPENFWSYTGGSIATLGTSTPVTYAEYEEFPNGKPPMRNYDSVLPGDGIFPNSTVFEMMDTQAGRLCYTYA